MKKAWRTWLRHWRRLVRGGMRALRPLDALAVLITHVPIMLLDDLSIRLLLRRLGRFPRVIEPRRGRAVAAVALAPGLGQTAFSAWWMGRFLARFFPFRVLFLRTPRRGNNRSFEEMVRRNLWIAAASDGLPLYGIGFSKGGLDLVWLWHALLVHGEARIDALFTIATPFRGSALARLVRTTGAKAITPESLELKKTLVLLSGLRHIGIQTRFFCALFDRVCRRSDSRPPRDDDFATPPARQQLADWLAWLASGTKQEATRPWYWSTTLPQVGHTALYNPFVWLLMGLIVLRRTAARPISS